MLNLVNRWLRTHPVRGRLIWLTRDDLQVDSLTFHEVAKAVVIERKLAGATVVACKYDYNAAHPRISEVILERDGRYVLLAATGPAVSNSFRFGRHAATPVLPF